MDTKDASVVPMDSLNEAGVEVARDVVDHEYLEVLFQRIGRGQHRSGEAGASVIAEKPQQLSGPGPLRTGDRDDRFEFPHPSDPMSSTPTASAPVDRTIWTSPASSAPAMARATSASTPTVTL